MRPLLLWILSLSQCWVCQIHAEEARHDMRELCRSEVGGTLLSAYNDVDFLKGLLAESDQKLKDIKLRRQSLELEYTQARSKTVQSVPVFDFDEKLVTMRFELDILSEQIREAELHIANNQRDYNKKLEFRKIFEALIQPVFHIVRVKDAPPGAYNIRTEYNHVCGIYELLCPLPVAQARVLQQITGKLSAPQWCLRYSQLLSP